MKKQFVFTFTAILLGLAALPLLRGPEPSRRSEALGANSVFAENTEVPHVHQVIRQNRKSQPIIAQAPPETINRPSIQASPGIQSFLNESLRLGHLSKDAKVDELRLDHLARVLTSQDARELLQTALDAHAGHGERFMATFLLAKRNQDFHAELAFIAKSDSPLFSLKTEPHTIEEMDKAFEVSMRVQALLGLERANSSGAIDPRELTEIFSDVQRSSHQGLIVKLAALGQEGSLRHDSLIEKYINGKLEGALHAESSD